MRPDLTRRLSEAGAVAGWQWTAEREQAVWEEVRRKRARAGVGGVAAVAVVFVVVNFVVDLTYAVLDPRIRLGYR